jgi:hypothetical protein
MGLATQSPAAPNRSRAPDVAAEEVGVDGLSISDRPSFGRDGPMSLQRLPFSRSATENEPQPATGIPLLPSRSSLARLN